MTFNFFSLSLLLQQKIIINMTTQEVGKCLASLVITVLVVVVVRDPPPPPLPP